MVMNRTVRTVKINSKNPEKSKDQAPIADVGAQKAILSPKKRFSKAPVKDKDEKNISDNLDSKCISILNKMIELV